MSIKPLLYFLAIAVATVSSQATQVYAQTPDSLPQCEEFTAAIEAMGDATIVSGLTAEETVSVSATDVFDFIDLVSLIEEAIGTFFDDVGDASLQSVQTETAQLTLPAGTLTMLSSDNEAPVTNFVPGDIIGFQGTLNDESLPEFAGQPTQVLVFEDLETNLQPFAFEPNSELGDACGVCISTLFGGFSPITNIVVAEIFDGDTSIATFRSGDDISFIAGPGQTITRIELNQVAFVTDIMVAFKQPVVEEVSSQQCLANIAAEIGDLADAATDSEEAYALNVACYALSFAARDEFFQEDGNRLTRYGSSVFTGAAYAISFLEYAGVEGTEDIVDSIIDKLEQIVDDEIDYAIANDSPPQFIERAEDLAEFAQLIDEDLDNPVVATVVYKLAWINAFFATY